MYVSYFACVRNFALNFSSTKAKTRYGCLNTAFLFSAVIAIHHITFFSAQSFYPINYAQLCSFLLKKLIMIAMIQLKVWFILPDSLWISCFKFFFQCWCFQKWKSGNHCQWSGEQNYSILCRVHCWWWQTDWWCC